MSDDNDRTVKHRNLILAAVLALAALAMYLSLFVKLS